MANYNFSQRIMVMIFIAVFSVMVLSGPNYFLKYASAEQTIPRYDGEIIFPVSNEVGINTNHAVSVIPTQNTTVSVRPTQNHTASFIRIQNTTTYDKTNSTEGFSNVICKSGYEYVQMTGQYTAGNVSYKVIFLQMVLLDNNGHPLAKGFGFVDDIDAYKTKTFNAITRYSSDFASCIIKIDGTIPK